MSQPLINITRKQALTFACFLVFYEFLTYIANDMIMPGMLKVVQTFHGPESAIASSLTAYVLGGASLQLFLGPLSDRYGRRPVMLTGATLFVICTAWIACSNSIEQFLVARFFQGMGLCFISVIGYATLQEIFAEMDAVRLIAIMANVSTIAPLLGPMLGAVFITYYSWRFIFVIIGFCALIALWGLWRYMPEPVGETKRDGEIIPRVSLAPRVILKNYKKLLTTPSFCFGSISLGLLGLPCIAWIGLAPVILIKEGHLTLIEYGIWQIPIFGAAILGNWFLQRQTHRGSLMRILFLGSVITGAGLLLTVIFPLLINSNYIWLLPGLIIYFFGLGVAGGPLSRYILFCTKVAKGTTSALMSMILMIIQAGGMEAVNVLYNKNHSNLFFALFVALVGLAYFIFLSGTWIYGKKSKLN